LADRPLLGCIAHAQSLYETLKEHLELHYHNETHMEEAVLTKYPLTIKRRVMRWV
jgi:hypothetical protein